MEKICIIKLGSMGDVLRTTPLLRKLKEEVTHITWITDERCLRFIKNSYVDNPLVFQDLPDVGHFDMLINLDEEYAACEVAEKISAKRKKGYGLKNGSFYPFDEDSNYAYRMTMDDELKFRENKKNYHEIIFQMAGFKFSGEEYILENVSEKPVEHDICLNYRVSNKFPLKKWPRWREFADMYESRISVSIQENYDTLDEYIRWISSGRVLITPDSLGMHVGIALQKTIIALIGNTSWHELNLYGRGMKLTKELACSPCYKRTCKLSSVECMNAITPEEVFAAYNALT